jgi:hypothetical protein
MLFTKKIYVFTCSFVYLLSLSLSLSFLNYIEYKEMFGDTKGKIRSRNSKNNLYNGQKYGDR